HSHSCAVYNDQIIFFGGMVCQNNSNIHRTNQVVVYNVLKKTWKIAQCGGDLPPQLWGHRVIVHKHHMYSFGGFASSFINDVYKLNLNTFQWYHVLTRHPRFGRSRTTPTRRHLHIWAKAGDFVYLIGGSSNSLTVT
ncbi:MAG: hypothetical protein CUN54_10130, partial [Phototrophicales bacterium]